VGGTSAGPAIGGKRPTSGGTTAGVKKPGKKGKR
jgi:hypothetical protein